VAFDGGGGLSVVADSTALVLQHGERGRKVAWGPRKAITGVANSSPSRRMVAVSQGKSGRGVTALASEAGGPILERMGEAAMCLSMGEKEWVERGALRRPVPFCGGSEARQRDEGGGGVQLCSRPRGANGGGVQLGLRVGQHGTDVVTLGCSDSGGRRTPHGRGGSKLRTREDGGVCDLGRCD
jgi:hypothetical protein